MRTWDILRGTWMGWLGFAIGSPFAGIGFAIGSPFAGMTCCLLGLPMGLLLEHLTRAQLSFAAGRTVRVQGTRRFLAGASAMAGLVGAHSSIFAGLAVVEGAGWGDAGKYAAIVVAPLVYGACVAPFAFLPLVLLHDEYGEGRIFGTALRVAGQLSTSRRLWLAAGWAMVFAGSVLAVEALPGTGVLLAVALWGVAMPVLVAQHVASYVEASRPAARVAPQMRPLEALRLGEDRGEGEDDDEPLLFPPFVRLLCGSAGVAGAVFVIVVLVSVLTPLPLQEVQRADREWSAEPLRIEGTALTLTPVEGGVRIEADDGGGVGHVAGARIDAVTFVRVDDERVRVLGRSGDAQYATVITNDGVRVDDGFAARLSSRLNDMVGISVGLALLTLLWAGRLLIRVATTRALLDLARTDDHSSASEVRVLEGCLRLDGALERRGRRWVPSGAARVEGASLRVFIPPAGVRTHGEEFELADGDPVSLIGRFPKLTSAALREHQAPWPEGALLVPGGRKAAAEALVRRAALSIAFAFAVIDALLVVASIALALSI